MLPYDGNLDRLIDIALDEDLAGGDITTDACIEAHAHAAATVIAKQDLVVAGLYPFIRTFMRLDPTVAVEPSVEDGAFVKKGTQLLHLSGGARSLLKGERPALNFLMRLSGIATFTRTMTEALKDHPGTRVVDTRKTTPGWRALEKAAVRAGGGRNHRFGLYDGVLIKENHIAAAGGITAAVQRARAMAHHLVKIEVETTNLDEVDEALDAGADCILLDNMDNATTKEAVKRIKGYSETRPVVAEASGNMSLARLPEVAACGVDIISIGALTHSAPAADISMLLKLA